MENSIKEEKDVAEEGDIWPPETPQKTYIRRRFRKDKPSGFSLCVASLENNNEAKSNEFLGQCGCESNGFGVPKERCFGLHTNEPLLMPSEQESNIDRSFMCFEDLKSKELIQMNSDADVAKRSHSESFIPGSSSIGKDQGFEQSEEKKKEDINVSSSTENLTPTTGQETNSKKRKKSCIDLNKTPRKKLKKKVHTPKILGEGKRKRQTQPKTPKPSTPKRVSIKKTASVNRKNKSNLNNSVGISEQVGVVERVEANLSCKRSLNFDQESPLEVQSSIVQVDEANASLGESIVSLNAASETLTICQGFPTTWKKSKRSPRTKKLYFMFGLPLAFKTKKNRSGHRTPRKELSTFAGNVLHENLKVAPQGENLAHEKQESEIFLMPKAKKDTLPTGRDKVGPSSLKLELDNGKREDGPSENEDLPSDYKPIDVAEEKVNTCLEMTPMLPDLNLSSDESEISLLEQKFRSFSIQSSGSNVSQHEHGAEAPLLEKALKEKLDIPLTDMPGQGQLSVVKKSKLKLMIENYSEQIHQWRFELKSICNGIEDNADNEAKEKLENERAMFHKRIEYFTTCMHVFLGNRNFSRWKGSVLDSVIGVFLTQNVSDILSSSAFMFLKAKYPVQSSSSNHESLNIRETNSEFLRSSFNKLLRNLSKTSGEESSNSKEQLASEKRKTAKKSEETDKEVETDWEEVRKKYCVKKERPDEHKDSVDWEAVRCAPVRDIAEAIKNRGQHNNLAGRIQEFLNRVIKLHQVLDLEWLRDTPPDLVKKYLLEFNGLGLKSVECIRLLALQNVAFPVDTNVGRIAVRLGWVPLEPLPEELQLHLLQKYPVMDSIQKYLWPRLSTLSPLELYKLHYHLITFGKVFCTKIKPKCNSCPLKNDCRHYASQYASARRFLPEPTREKKSSQVAIHTQHRPKMCEPIIEEPLSPKLPHCHNQIQEAMIAEPSPFDLSQCQTKICEPIIEEPLSPEPEPIESLETDIEDWFSNDDPNKIETIVLSRRLSEATTALVPLAPEMAEYPMPKLKQVSRLRTKHLAYLLPDDHPLLAKLEKRDDKDPLPYLLLIWPPDESVSSQESENFSNFVNEDTIRGTILIPSRTAMKGSFPLNGTYFQVNEVFADHETSHHPINVPTELLWNLPREIVYFGTSTSAIFGGLTVEEIGYCFWKGFMSVRAFERTTGLPKALAERLHISTTQQAANRKKEKKEK